MKDLDGLGYEFLICRAFKCARYGDPLGLANVGILAELDRTKLGVTYALAKIRYDLVNCSLPEGVPYELSDTFDKLWKQALNAVSPEEIAQIIEEATSLLNKHKGIKKCISQWKEVGRETI